MKKIHLAALAILLTIQPLTAPANGTYKWVDKEGRVHFSDRSAENAEQIVSDQAETIGTPAMAIAADTSNPLIRPYSRTARPLVMSAVNYEWKEKVNASKDKIVVGTFRSGKTCTPREDILVPDAYISHASIFTDEDTLAYTVLKTIKALDYTTNHERPERMVSEARKVGGLILESTIIALKIDVCAENTKEIKVKNIYAGAFRKSSATVTVQWKLLDPLTSTTVWRGNTIGNADSGSRGGAPGTILSDAIVSATRQLLSDATFANNLLVEKNIISRSPANEYSLTPRSAVVQAYPMRLESSPISFFTPATTPITITAFFGSDCATAKKLNENEARLFERRIPVQATLGQEVRKNLVDLKYSVAYGFGSKGANTEFRHVTISLTNVLMDVCYSTLPAQAKFTEVSKYVNLGRGRRTLITANYDWVVSTESGAEIASGSAQANAGGLDAPYDSIIFNDVLGVQIAAYLSQNEDFLKSVTRYVVDTEAASTFPYTQTPHSLPSKAGKEDLMPVLFSGVSFVQMLAASNVSDLGFVYAGTPCEAVDKIHPEKVDGGPWYYPYENEYSPAIADALNQAGFKLSDKITASYNDAPISLEAKLIELRYDICAPTYAPTDIMDARLTLNSRFKVGRAYIKVEWRMIDRDSNDVLFTDISEGVVDHWNIASDNFKKEVLPAALADSLKATLSKPAAEDVLTSHLDKSFWNQLLNW